MTGYCRMGGSCPNLHDPASQQQPGSRQTRPNTSGKPCQYFLAGSCREGDQCKDVHDEDSGPPEITAAGGAGFKLPAVSDTVQNNVYPQQQQQHTALAPKGTFPPWIQQLPIEDKDRASLVREGINKDSFVLLEESDLKEMGIAIGPRKILMQEIGKLKA